jgi:hypothetical protein
MNKFTAGMFLSKHSPMTYDQALEFALQKEDTQKLMVPTDWAWMAVTSAKNEAFKMCEALNIHDDLNRTEHLKPVNVIFSYDKGKVTEERTLMILRNTPVHRVLNECKDMICGELVLAKLGYRIFMDLEVVEV